MTGIDVATSFARTFVDELARGGVTHAVVSPGGSLAGRLAAAARGTRDYFADRFGAEG